MFFTLLQHGSFLDHTRLIQIKQDDSVQTGKLPAGLWKAWLIPVELLVHVQGVVRHKSRFLIRLVMFLARHIIKG